MSPYQSASILDTHYEFFPSVRAGYRPNRTYGETLSGRSTFGVELTVEGKRKDGDWEEAERTPSTTMRMYGPGDVAGINEQQVVRVEPEPDTATMPPNYFPLVEFARPDLPWLFSPERADPDDGGKVRPWCCLVVVPKTNDAVSVEADGTRPLPALRTPQDQLPPHAESWAWAHTQVTGKLSDPELDRMFTERSGQAVSRLLCPRNLDANTRYVAAVVPTFEPSRRGGLGKEPFEGSGEPTIEPAWDETKSEGTTLPVYHHWEFTTGAEGDFETLARRLEPRQLSEAGVGAREVDISDPGPPQTEAPDTTLTVGGALMSPGIPQTPFPRTDNGTDHARRYDLRSLLNDPGGTESGGDSKGPDEDPLPVVGPPIYGQWYLPSEADWSLGDDGQPAPPDVPTMGPFFDSWVHELNLDPRWRLPAGYGTEVVQENQEGLMERAWKQFGDLEWANERVGRSQLGELVGTNVTDRFDAVGDHALGVSPLLRDFEELHREITAAGRLTDDGALGDRDPAPQPGARLDETTLPDRELSKTLLTDGEFGVGADLAAGGEGKRLNELRLQQSPDGSMRGDGGSDAVPDPKTLSRFDRLTSPAYRRLTRTGGTLDRGVETDSRRETFTNRLGEGFTFDTDSRLGSRFSGAGAAGPPVPDSQAGAEQGAPPSPARKHWRLDAQGTVMTLSEAAEELDGDEATVPRAMLTVESARDHCETARDRLSELAGALATDADAVPPDAIRAVTERPTVGDQCDAIRRNTFDTLDRQFGKLVAAGPEAVEASFSQAKKEMQLASLRSAHTALLTAVDAVSEAIRTESEPPADLRADVQSARSAIDGIEEALDALAAPIDSGLGPPGGMRAMSGSLDGSSTGRRPVSPDLTSVIDQSDILSTAVADRHKRLRSGTSQYPGLLDAGAWTRNRAAWDIHPDLGNRDVALGRILAAPEFDDPTFRWLRDVDQQYLLPGAQKVPPETIGALQTNSEFIESFMCGLNHEFARELQWRRYPTDRRGTFFRQFWDYIGEEQRDVQPMSDWGATPLGGNRSPGISDDRVVLLLKGDLLRAYPNTRIYAVKAVKEDTDDGSGTDWDRVPLLPSLRAQAIDDDEVLRSYEEQKLAQSAWDPRTPIFSGRLDPDITFLGFDLSTDAAVGDTIAESSDDDDLGWFFVLEERVGETRFGLDTAGRADYGAVPGGIETGSEGSRTTKKLSPDDFNSGAEAGWNALSWGHLSDDADTLEAKKYVRVDEDVPSGGDDADPWAVRADEEWNTENTDTWTNDDAAEWGTNSAHMARITWQLPVRICIHADDILPALSDDDRGYTFDRPGDSN